MKIRGICLHVFFVTGTVLPRDRLVIKMSCDTVTCDLSLSHSDNFNSQKLNCHICMYVDVGKIFVIRGS